MLTYTNKHKQNLIDALQEYRLKSSISQRQLADELKVHYTTINEWFKKRRKPNDIQSYRLEEFLKKNT